MPAAVRLVSTFSRDLFEKQLIDFMNELSNLGYELEVIYKPVFNGYDIIYTALVLGWEAE